MKLFKLKTIVVVTLILSSFGLLAQNVDLVASVDITPPLNVGQTFTYTLVTAPGGNNYRGVSVFLNYNVAVIQLNSLTPDNSLLNLPLVNNTSTPGEILYSAGALSNINAATTLFTAVFEVIGTSEDIMIIHDLEVNGNPNGSAVTNAGGQNIIGIANDIILSTLSVEQLEFSNSISVFPNPVNDVLNIKLSTSNSNIESIKIHTVDGKLIQQYNTINLINNLIQIDTSKLNRAMYFATIISSNKEVATYKIMVNR